MTRARHVLRVIDQAMAVLDRHPTLYAQHARRDASPAQLLRALERYKTERPEAHPRPFRDEVEPVDAATVERMARQAEEEDRGRRLRLNTIERKRRTWEQSGDGLRLVAEAIGEAKRISTVGAGNIEPSRGDSTTGTVPKQQRFEDDPRWELADRQIHRAAMVLMELIDEARGFSRSAAIAALSGVEKDKAIREEGVGLSAEQLFIRLGPEYGSISHIRRYRREQKLDTRGRPQPDERAT